MAIQYVGHHVEEFGSTVFNPMSGLTGGIASSAQAGDYILITSVVAFSASRPVTGVIYNSNSGNTDDLEVIDYAYVNDSNDTSMSVLGHVMTADNLTDDPGAIGLTVSAHSGGSMMTIMQVWRGVNITSPLDVAAVGKSIVDTGIASFNAITPVTTDAVIVALGGAAMATGAVFTSSLTNFQSICAAGTTFEAVAGAGYYTGWTSGAYTPTTWGGSSNNAANSARTVVLALRPAATATIYNDTITGSSAGSDTAAVAGTFVASQADSLAATDEATGGLVHGANITDAGASGDTLGAVAQVNASLTGTAASSDTVTGGSLAIGIVVDPATAGDGATGGSTFAGMLTDAGTARDDQPRPTGNRTRYGTVTDSASGGNAVAGHLIARPTLMQSAAAGDAASAGANAVLAAVTEARPAAEAVTQALVYTLTISDACAGQDTIAAVATFVAAVDDDGATADDLGLDGQSIYRVVATDVAPATDDNAVVMTGVSEALSAAEALDSVGLTGVFYRAIEDEGEAEDTADIEIVALTPVASSAGSTDSVDAEVIVSVGTLDFARARGYFDDHASRRRRAMWLS